MLRKILLTTLLWWVVCPAFAVSVVFINPGRPDEAYWRQASQGMYEAAKSLDMTLEVLYAERDHTKAIALAHQVAALPRPQRPDYLIITNDYGAAPAMLRAIEPAGIATFLAFSGIHGQERAMTGAPRTKFAFWLGSLEPRAADAGQLTVQTLIEKARKLPSLRGGDGKLHLLAIAGDRSTPSSIARTEGMLQTLKKSPDVVLEQLVYGEWQRDKAAEQARWLYDRYPQAKLVWAGSDMMAFGAMDVWRERGGKPGTDALFSGINTSKEAMQSINSGELSALAGGHFLCGAWAMVMLYDHANGRDFREEGLELEFPMFTLFDPALVRRFQYLFLPSGPNKPFRAYSKTLQPSLRQYNFQLEPLLR